PASPPGDRVLQAPRRSRLRPGEDRAQGARPGEVAARGGKACGPGDLTGRGRDRGRRRYYWYRTAREGTPRASHPDGPARPADGAGSGVCWRRPTALRRARGRSWGQARVAGRRPPRTFVSISYHVIINKITDLFRFASWVVGTDFARKSAL